jgi:hypothetical protein
MRYGCLRFIAYISKDGGIHMDIFVGVFSMTLVAFMAASGIVKKYS